MPKIKIYEQTQSIPRTTGVRGLQLPGVQDNTGKALMQLGDAVNDFAIKMRVEDEQRQIGSLKVRTIRDLAQLETSLRADPDFATHPDQFREGVAVIQKSLAQEHPAVWKDFEAVFGQHVERTAIQVQSNAHKKQIDHSEATMLTELDELTRAHGNSTTDLQRDMIVDAAKELVAGRVASGVITQVKGTQRMRGFASGITETQVRQDLFADPQATETALLKGAYPELSPEKRVVWLERATAKVEADRARSVRDGDRQEREAEKALKLAQEQTAKDGWQLLAKNELTLDWVVGNEAKLSKSDYRALLDKLTGDEASDDDNDDVVADLYTRVATEDVSADAIAAFKRGELRRETMSAILSRNDKFRGGQGPRDAYKRAADYIKTSLGVNEMANIPGQRRRLADAIMDFDAWTERNPDAKDQDTLETARRLVREYSVMDWNRLTISLPAPDWLAGSRLAPDIEKSKQALVERFMQKHGDDRAKVAADPEYQRAVRVLRQWEAAVRMRDLSTGANQ